MTQLDTVPGADIKPWLRHPPKKHLFIHANIIDNGKIETVYPSTPSQYPDGYNVVDCKGRYLCPGLFDAHVHLCATPGYTDVSRVFGNPSDISLLRQPYVASQMLYRGFTSVRDCGGAQLPLKEAIEEGVFPGPRLFISGHALSQTGGHGDLRSSYEKHECCGGHAIGSLGRICNGVPECMAAVRDEVRCGADFIKIMGSGGVASPTDKLEQLQFTTSEIRDGGAIRHCIDNGVKGIEHGNFVDAPTARLMAEKGVYLTPTLITYAQMATDKWKNFLPPESQVKNAQVLKSGLEALRIASEAGVTMCYGSDLLGPLGSAQIQELSLRSQALKPLEILRSATVNPAKMMGCETTLGQLKEGFQADVLIMEKNPLENIEIFDHPEKYILAVMKDGLVYRSQLESLEVDGGIPMRFNSVL
ncbi:linoleate diol synthase [Fusarium agapanthi]|uniref:Linoleate diol synthase n=1 Tax=Fusarium agapanthi TaxID=1803897 RepID=A0A9P5BKS3_9HYPO|nr:linoleate diol synthase [Fusarium agapanthi]